MRRFTILLGAAAFICLVGCAAFASGYTVTETTLGPYPNNWTAYVISRDGCHIAFVVKNGQKQFVSLDGKQGPEYDEITDLILSSEATHLVSHEGSRYSAFGVLSPEKLRVAYAARIGDKWTVVVDGEEDPKYDAIGKGNWDRSRGSLTFSPDGKHLAYEAKRGGKSFVVLDGSEGPAFDAIKGTTFSLDGKRIAYIGVKDGKSSVVVDGKPGPEYDYIAYYDLVFSPDGKRLAYEASNNNTQCMVVDGKPMPNPRGYFCLYRPVFSPDGKRLACIAMRGFNQFVVVDGRPDSVMEYDIDPGSRPLFSPNGTLMYVALGVRTTMFVVTNGQPGPKYDGIRALTLSPDGKHLAYVAKEGGKWLLVMDGAPGQEVVDCSFPIFSPDGKRLAYIAKSDERSVVVVDGKPGPKCDSVSNLAFSPDGKHLAYEARGIVGRGGESLVIDGQEVTHDLHVLDWAFSADGSLHYYVFKDGSLVRVTCTSMIRH